MAPAPDNSLSSVLIETRALARVHAHHQPSLLQPTDFQLHNADRVVITGASGSGKSVFLRLLCGLDQPSAGQLFWQGRALLPALMPRYRSRVCYLAQRPALLAGSVEDNLRFPFTLSTHRNLAFDATVVNTLLLAAGKTSAFLASDAAELSGGEAQIVALIRVLQLAPDVLLLDEPTAALDAASAMAVETLIDNWLATRTQTPRALVWVTHDQQQASRVGTRRLAMQAGVLTEVGAR